MLDYVGRQDKKDRKQLMLEPMPLTSMLCEKEKEKEKKKKKKK